MLRINFAIFLIFAFYFVNSFAAPDHQRQEVSYVTGEFHLNYCVRKRLVLRNDVLAWAGLCKNRRRDFSGHYKKHKSDKNFTKETKLSQFRLGSPKLGVGNLNFLRKLHKST